MARRHDVDEKEKSAGASCLHALLIYFLLPLGVLIVVGVMLLFFMQKLARDQVPAVREDLDGLAAALRQYNTDHGRYPESLEEFAAAGGASLSLKDPFAPDGANYGYINIRHGAMVCVYSVGRAEPGEYLMVEVTENANAAGAHSNWDFENTQIDLAGDDPDNGIVQFMRALMASRATPSDATAEMANEKADMVRELGWEAAVKAILASPMPTPPPMRVSPGWRQQGITPTLLDLESMLAANETAFALIREGAERPEAYCRLSLENISEAARVPNFLRIQCLAKIMIANGKRAEASGDYASAMEDYLALIQFAKATGTSGTLIAKLIQVAIEGMAWQAVRENAQTGQYPPEALEAFHDKAQRLARDPAAFEDAYYMEHLRFLKGTDDVKMNDFMGPSKGPMPPMDEAMARYHLQFNRPGIKRNNARSWQAMIESMQTPWSEQQKFDLIGLVAESDPINKISIPNFVNTNVRGLVMQSAADGAVIAIALEHYRAVNGRYPESLDAAADVMSATLPVDFLAAGPYIYQASGTGYELRTPGVDEKDDGGVFRYDPTNGTVSGGDILFGRD